MEATLGQIAHLKSGRVQECHLMWVNFQFYGGVHFWEVPFAPMLSPGWIDYMSAPASTSAIMIVWCPSKIVFITTHPGVELGANLKSISNRCHLLEVAFV